MRQLEDVLTDIRQAAEHPLDTARAYCRDRGKRAIGWFKGYVPEELVYALDMHPVGLWGGPVELAECGRYFPAFYCAPVRQNLELGIRGELDFLSGVIVPELCDTLKAVGQNWKVAVPHIPVIPLYYPHNRKADFGRAFLRTELDAVRRQLEEIAGREMEGAALGEAIRTGNRYRRALRAFCDVAADYPVTITPKVRHQVLVAGQVLDRGEYAPVLESLTERLREREPETTSARRVVLTGTALDSPEILDMLSDVGLTVAGDDLLRESRQFRLDTHEDAPNPVDALVGRWAETEGCPLAYDPEKKRGDLLIEQVRRCGADGVLFCITTFCDPDEYDYPLLRGRLLEAGIPSLRIEINAAEGTAEQVRTRLEGFGEMLAQTRVGREVSHDSD